MGTDETGQVDRVFVPHVGWMAMPKGDDVTRRVREGWFESPELAAWILMLGDRDTVIDGGAHAGLYSALAAGLVGESGRVVAVEPNAALAAMARENLRAHTNASVEEAALWRESGTLTLGSDSRGAAYGSVGAQGSGESVRGVTVDELAAAHRIGHVTVLKLDIEGAELEALKGASGLIGEKRIGVVMVELTRQVMETSGRDAQEVLGPLLDAGYTACRFDSGAMTLASCDLGSLSEHENLFVCADVDAVRSRIASAGPERFAVARDLIERGAAVGALSDAAVEREHLQGVVESLREDLARAHGELAAQRERADSVLRAQADEITSASSQWASTHDELTRTIGQLNEALAQTHEKWSESGARYEETVETLRAQLEETRAQLSETHARWAESREAYEAALTGLRAAACAQDGDGTMTGDPGESPGGSERG